MPILNRAAELQDSVAEWRRHLHENPELGFDVHQTAGFVAQKLKEFGCDSVEEGIGRTGVVGIIHGKGDSPRMIGMRADMDALPLDEISGKPHASTVPGKMHACGHDGHTAMLLGAAQYLCETRNFSGRIAVVFQPAEEGLAGGKAMVDDGLMDRFPIEEIYGLHNLPGLAPGHFAICPGPIMAATAEFFITVKGRGGHAAFPHQTIDPIVAGSQLVQALQTIPSRSADPLDALVVTVTQFHAGDALNIIPEEAKILGTVRCLDLKVQDLAERRMRDICQGIADTHGARIDLRFERNYPVTVNHPDQTDFAAGVAVEISGDSAVDSHVRPTMGGEDFSYMLEARPGAFIFLGQGDTPGLHHPAYDFNDDIIPAGISYWVRLAEKALAA